MKGYTMSIIEKQLSLGRQIASRILVLVRDQDIHERLAALDLLASLPPLPDRGAEYRQYQETRRLYKQIFSTCASVIVHILSMDLAKGQHDPGNSFNYTTAPEPVSYTHLTLPTN